MRGHTGRLLACFVGVLALSANFSGSPVAALCLTLITNAVVLWHTRSLHRVDEFATPLSPPLLERINRDGGYYCGVEADFARSGPGRLRAPNSSRT